MPNVPLLPIQRGFPGAPPGCAVVRLEQPGKPVVVLDLELIQRLEATLNTLRGDCHGLVLASASERVFVAGADLKSISELDDAALLRYLEYGARVFAMLHELPFPTVAAINGAALGGGLELAMHCDALVAAPPPHRDGVPGKPYAVGLPEAGLGLCPGWGGTNLLPARSDPADAIRRTAIGQTMTFDEASNAGLFQSVADSADGLLPAAFAALRDLLGTPLERDGTPRTWIGRPSRIADTLRGLDQIRPELPATEAATAVVSAVNAGLTKGWHAALDVERRELVRLRHTAPARAALEAFFTKSKK